MYTKKMAYLLIVLSSLMFLGCGGGSSSDSPSVVDLELSDNPSEVDSEQDIEPTPEPSSELSQDLIDSITYMYNEEGLAYDVYLNVYNELNTTKGIIVPQLFKIATNSEIKHIAVVNALAIKYDLNMTTYDPTIEPYSIEGIGNGVYSVQHVQ